MTNNPATQSHIADDVDPIAQERIGRHAAWLAEFGELVLRASRAVASEIEAAAPQRPLSPAKQSEPNSNLESLSRALKGLGRALRMTCALETRLDQERKGLLKLGAERQAHARRVQQRQAQDLDEAALDRTDAVREAIETLIETRPEREHEDLFDRADEAMQILDALDPAEILKRPVSTWIARTCETLNLAPDWPLWEDQPWAELEDRTPNSPYAKRRFRAQPPSPRPLPATRGEGTPTPPPLPDPGERAGVRGPP